MALSDMPRNPSATTSATSEKQRHLHMEDGLCYCISSRWGDPPEGSPDPDHPRPWVEDEEGGHGMEYHQMRSHLSAANWHFYRQVQSPDFHVVTNRMGWQRGLAFIVTIDEEPLEDFEQRLCLWGGGRLLIAATTIPLEDPPLWILRLVDVENSRIVNVVAKDQYRPRFRAMVAQDLCR